MNQSSRSLTWLLPLLIVLRTPASSQPYNPIIDITHYDYTLKVNDANDRITGLAAITLTFKTSTDSFLIDLDDSIKVLSVSKDHHPVSFTHQNDHLSINTPGIPGPPSTFIIRYEGIPSDGLIISKNKFGHRVFFGDNWPNRAHRWLPCVDHPSDKASVDFHIIAPDHYTVVANGALQSEKPMPGHFKVTHWKESAPLSPKIMMIGIADFAVDHPGDIEGTPILSYVFPENKDSGFHSYANALNILPFYIHHIGPYPFEKCGNVQSKTRFGGLENASAICYFENSVTSRGIESLMAHEIAHQWFGDAATEKDWSHVWLSEGFASYMTHCYLENRYGIDTLKTAMAKDRRQVFEFEKKRLTPIVDSSVTKDFMELLNPNSYQKGSWVLHMLRRKIGDTLFWKGISTYYSTYRNSNASTNDFQKIMEQISGQNLQTFFHQWLYTPGHPSIKLEWRYDTASGAAFITTTQQQPTLFDFPLELSIDGIPYTMQVNAQTNQVRIPLAAEPSTIIPDPDINVLAEVSL